MYLGLGLLVDHLADVVRAREWVRLLVGLSVLVVIKSGLLWVVGVVVGLFRQGDGLVEKAALVLIVAILLIWLLPVGVIGSSPLLIGGLSVIALCFTKQPLLLLFITIIPIHPTTSSRHHPFSIEQPIIITTAPHIPPISSIHKQRMKIPGLLRLVDYHLLLFVLFRRFGVVLF